MKHTIKSLSVTVILITLFLWNSKAQMLAQDGRVYKTVKIGNQEWIQHMGNFTTGMLCMTHVALRQRVGMLPVLRNGTNWRVSWRKRYGRCEIKIGYRLGSEREWY